MQAEREKRATVLTAEGQQQAAVLKAQGEKQAAVLQAEGEKQAAILQSEGQAEALIKVQSAQAEAVTRLFTALNKSGTTPEILKYLYIQNLPKLAEGSANKPSSSLPSSRESSPRVTFWAPRWLRTHGPNRRRPAMDRRPSSLAHGEGIRVSFGSTPDTLMELRVDAFGDHLAIPAA